MSLRTKLLAAILGLNGAILLLALYLLLRSEPGQALSPSRAAVANLIAFGSAVAEVPVGSAAGGPRADGALAEHERLQAIETLDRLEKTGLVTDLVVVQERGANDHQIWSARTFLDPNGPGPELAPRSSQRLRAQDAFQQARRQTDQWTWTATDEIASVLPAVPGQRGRRGVVARYLPPPDPRSRVQGVYVVMVAGAILLMAVAFLLVSRMVIRPLGKLTEAADRIARGDYRIRVEPRGTNDELDRTTTAFNRMAREIAEYQGHLEDRVLSALGRMKKAEQHLTIAQRLAATGKLASGVAHEINNPLGGMKNAIRAIARGHLSPEKTEEYLALIGEGLGRIEETVKKFLSFTPRRVEPRPTDLGEVASKAADLALHRIERSNARLELESVADPPAVVFGDPFELQQVALNLLLNAADAVAGRPEARIRLRVARRGDDVVLEISDNGVGLTAEDQDRCFDMFFTTKPVGEGSGLGLAVAHSIVTNHGGRIEIESTPGEGATFRVLLPAETEERGSDSD